MFRTLCCYPTGVTGPESASGLALIRYDAFAWVPKRLMAFYPICQARPSVRVSVLDVSPVKLHQRLYLRTEIDGETSVRWVIEDRKGMVRHRVRAWRAGRDCAAADHRRIEGIVWSLGSRVCGGDQVGTRLFELGLDRSAS